MVRFVWPGVRPNVGDHQSGCHTGHLGRTRSREYSSAYGLYQAPSSMPANSVVTVTATSASSSSLSASDQFSLVNPTPAIYNVYTAQGVLIPGTTNSTTISGGNFTPDEPVRPMVTSLPQRISQSPNPIAQIPVPINAQGSVPITVQNPAPGWHLPRLPEKDCIQLHRAFRVHIRREEHRYGSSGRYGPTQGDHSERCHTGHLGRTGAGSISATVLIKLHPACRQIPLSL